MGDGGRSGNLSEPPGALARLWRGQRLPGVWGGGEKDSPLPDSAGFQTFSLLTFRPIMIYILVSTKINGRCTMQTAKIFINGRSQAVRLPKDFRFSGNDVFIKKIGKMVVLLPKDDPWSSLVKSLDQFTDDFMDSRDQPDQDSREKF